MQKIIIIHIATYYNAFFKSTRIVNMSLLTADNVHKRQVLIFYLYSHGVYSSSDFKTSLFKHHYWCIIDASSCRSNQVQVLDFNRWALETMQSSRTWNTTETVSPRVSRCYYALTLREDEYWQLCFVICVISQPEKGEKTRKMNRPAWYERQYEE